MRLFFLWLAAALSTGLGLAIAYLGSALSPGGKGSASDFLIIGLPVPLILLGLVGLVSSVAGIWWSQLQLPAAAIAGEGSKQPEPIMGSRERSSDVPARVGFVLAAASLASEILFFVGISIVPGSYFGAPGAAGMIPVVGFAAWPLALCAAVISWLALIRTTNRSTALVGVTLGSLTLLGLPAWFLLASLGFFGGD
jgi:hypothetical protein